MIGIIVMSYGSPLSVDDIDHYFSHILNGRIPPIEQLKKVKDEFLSLESPDPLGFYTEQQAEALQNLLQLKGHEQVRVYPAFKHAAPFVEDAVKQLVEEDVSQIFTLPLTPIYSKTGVGQYQQMVRDYVEQLGSTIPVSDIGNWHLHETFVEVLAKRVSKALAWLSKEAQMKTTVVFTAHSKPGTAEKNQEYCEQFMAIAEQVAKKAAIANWKIAYRSGRPNQEWLSPDVKEVIKQEADAGQKGIVVCELLSITANMEVLSEIGYECKQLSNSLGLEFVRSEFLNDSTDFLLALSTIVETYLENALVKSKGDWG